MQNSEILVLTYGSVVRQLVSDCTNVADANAQLEKMQVQ